MIKQKMAVIFTSISKIDQSSERQVLLAKHQCLFKGLDKIAKKSARRLTVAKIAKKQAKSLENRIKLLKKC